MRYLLPVLGLAFLLPCYNLADEEQDASRGNEEVANRYEILMIDFINSKSFEKMLKDLRDRVNLGHRDMSFFVAGYIRAWVEYREHQALIQGRGLGMIENLMPGVLHYEMKGWLEGCRAAAAQGRKFDMKVLREVRQRLKEEK